MTNLIDILSSLTGERAEAIESRYEGSGYGQFKTDVGDAVVEAVAPIQERYRELRADPVELQRLLAPRRREGAEGVGADARRRCSTGWASSRARRAALRAARPKSL